MPAALEYAKHHPVTVGVGVVGVGLLLLYLMNSGGSSGGSGGGADAEYYAAQSAQAQAGDAVQIAQIQAQSSTTQTQLNDQASVLNTGTVASSDLAATENTNATNVALAPFAVQAGVVSGLSQAALTPPITNTQVNPGNSGFFGLFSTPTTTQTTVTPSPVATNAVDQLDTYLNGFSAGH
jgi:hypothetical protein